MPRPRDEEKRVIGPTWLPSRKRWRVIVKSPGEVKEEDRERSRLFVGITEAEAYAEEIAGKLARLNSCTIEVAIQLYDQFLTAKGTGQKSRDETCRRFRAFFEKIMDRKISRLSPEECAELYIAFRNRLKKNGDPISADYQLNTLAETKSFLRWCVKQGWLVVSPIEDVEPLGQREVGKDQMTGDEASALFKWCLWRAHRGDHAALAIMMALSMGLRSSDLSKRLVRDVDLNGTALRVGLERKRRSKSKKGDRARRIPVALQPLVRKVIEGREKTEVLFPSEKSESGHHTKSWLRAAMKRFCNDAGIPYFCPHSLKGTAGTALAEGGELADRIAEFLSHEDKRVSERNYIADGAVANGQVERNFEVLAGGKAAG
jgi:integrase